MRCCGWALPGPARAPGAPAAYGVVGSEAEGQEIVRRLEAELGAGGRAEAVRFDNGGARVEEVP